MNDIHIMWSQLYQPMIRHRVPYHDHVVRINPRKVYRCHDCNQPRWAKYLRIRVEYDYVHVRCAESDHGGRWTAVTA